MQRKTFDKQVKLAVVHELDAGKTIAQVCREYEITSNMALRWKRECECLTGCTKKGVHSTPPTEGG